ncbi:MAG: PadR family transcriptional regulator [Brevefilum sp.]
MSLTHVILGWLSYEPMTGYDLNAVIEISTQHFWSTSQSQIYRTLSKIEAEGWVTQEVILQEDRPPRKVYEISTEGRAELQRWLAAFHEPDPPRIPWLVQVFFAGQISDSEILAVLREKQASLQSRLGRIRAARGISAEQFEPDEDPRNIFYWMLTIDYGEMKLQSQIDWIEGVIEKIQNRDYKSPDFLIKYEQKKEQNHEEKEGDF